MIDLLIEYWIAPARWALPLMPQSTQKTPTCADKCSPWKMGKARPPNGESTSWLAGGVMSMTVLSSIGKLVHESNFALTVWTAEVAACSTAVAAFEKACAVTSAAD